ncbi:MAG: hypothetical protein JRH20_14380 [Deltaproteobacteria bacterium]|nr:hypothetical protein [Deltaproteobacteria bacterium]
MNTPLKSVIVLSLSSVLFTSCVRFGFWGESHDTQEAGADGPVDVQLSAERLAGSDSTAQDSTAQDSTGPDSTGPDSTGPDSTGPDGAATHLDAAAPDSTQDGSGPVDAWLFDADPSERWETIDLGTTERLNGVWGANPDDLWFCGTRGALIRRTPLGVDHTHSGQVAASFYGIHGVAADAAYVVGGSGTIMRWNGLVWQVETSPTSALLHGVWATSSLTAWAVGGEDVLYRSADGQWQVVHTEVDALFSVWASSDTNVWVAGNDGPVYHFDGANWQTVWTAPGLATLSAIRGRGTTDVWVTGHRADVYQWTGSTFEARGAPGELLVWALWLAPGGDVWVGDGAINQVRRYDGTQWHIELDVAVFDHIYGLWGFGDHVVWAAAYEGKAFLLAP